MKESSPIKAPKQEVSKHTEGEVRTLDEILKILKTESTSGVSLGNKEAELLIEKGEARSIPLNLEKFVGLGPAIASAMIEKGWSRSVAENLGKFVGLDTAIALALIEEEGWRPVALNLEKFVGPGAVVAFALVEKGGSQSVAKNLGKFEGLNHSKIARQMIEEGEARSVALNLEKFEGLNHSEIARQMIEKGGSQSVAENLEKFVGLNHSEIARQMIEKGEARSVDLNLEKFVGLDTVVASAMIEKGWSRSVAENLEKFEGLNYNEIALLIIEKGGAYYLVNNLKKVKGLSTSVALLLIKNGEAGRVLSNLEKFEGLNYNEIALLLIERGNAETVVENLEKFEGLNYNEIALLMIEKGGAYYVVENLEKFEGLNHNEIALFMIEKGEGQGEGHTVLSYLSKFEGLDSRVCIAAAHKGAYELLSVLFDTDWAPHMATESLLQIGGANKKLQQAVTSIAELFPNITLFDRYFVAVSLCNSENDIDFNLEIIRNYPFLKEHLFINSRMAVNLIAKLPEFDDVALAHISRLHIVDNVELQNPIMREKLLEQLPSYLLPASISKIPATLDMLDQSNRARAIDNLRAFEHNPEILKALTHAGVSVERWLHYDKEETFTLGSEDEISLAANNIATPLNRLTFEIIEKFASSFKEGFIASIPSTMMVSETLDTKRSELTDKITAAKEALAAATDEQKRVGIARGIESLERALLSYKVPLMRNAIHSALDALIVQGNAIAKLRLDQEAVLGSDGIRTRQEIQTLKKKDDDIVAQTKILLERFEKAIAMIKAAGEEIGVSYDLFETKELFEHFNEDASAIRNALALFEREAPNALAGREIKIGICNRNPYSSLYLGNYTGCCVSIEGPIHGEESPIADYLTDLGMQLVVSVDTTVKGKPVPVAVAWCYIGETEEGKPVLQIDNIEANTGYTDRYKKEFTDNMTKYLHEYADSLSLPLYQGGSYNDLVVADIEDNDKLGDLYNREGGYYLEAELE